MMFLSRISTTGLALVLLALIAAPLPATAITPEEMLADPALESRARALSKQLRCLVCQNQSIDDSDAELARDLRVEVRKQLATGASDVEIMASLRATYGDYVLLNPPVSPGTYILWGAPVVIFLGGLAIMLAGRRRRDDEETITPEDETAPTASTANRNNRKDRPIDARIALTLASLVMAASLGLYLVLGRADLPARPLADRGGEIAAASQQARETAQDRSAALLEAREQVAITPNDVGAWLQLAMAAAGGDGATEIMALEQADRLTDGDPSIRALRAEAMARAADGQVTLPARQLIAQILAVNPAEPRALYLSGLAAYQDEDYAAAVSIWRRLETLSPPDAPWMDLLAENIVDAARSGGLDPANIAPAPGPVPGPDAEAVSDAASMTEDERAAMIEGMVERLATRLAGEPGDAEGWRRLIRAYQVLDRVADTQVALIGLADALPDDIDVQLSALEHMVVTQLEAGFIDESQRLLARVGDLDPQRPEGLYIRGHFARQAGDIESARTLWEDLLDRLPANAPIAPQLRRAIDGL